MPDEEVAFVGNHLFGGPDGRAAAQQVDRHIDRLPGLAGMQLATRANERLAA